MIDRHYNFNYSSGVGENGYLIKIYNLSIRYYNRGIVLAKEGKYTEAVHSLRKSVALKKIIYRLRIYWVLYIINWAE